MRKEFVEVKTKKEAETRAPWAAVIIRAEGGYWCFESIVDAETWKKQK